MARPIKQGLDYFALDVNMNDEVEIIEAQHGLDGFAILVKLFQKIYAEGYFYEWGDKEQILFSNRVSVDRNKVVTIVSDCIKWNIFNEQMYNKHKILTSRRIQSQYFASVYKRVNVEAIREYLLINVSDKTNISFIGVSDVINLDISGVSDIQSTQSKVKESKVNKSIVNNNKEDGSGSYPQVVVDNFSKDENLAKVAILFEQNGFGTINYTVKEILIELLELYSVEWIDNAMKKAVEANKRSIGYVKGILKNWHAGGGMKLEPDKKNLPKAPSAKKTRFHNLESRTAKYTPDEINKKVEEIAERKKKELRENRKREVIENE